MWLLLLAYLERTLGWIQMKTDQAKQKLREWLGPAPQNYLLLADGRVLPANIQIPEEAERATTYLFEATTSRMTLLNQPIPTSRFRQLHVISCTLQKGEATYDLSDWISEIRANPVPPTVPLKQYVQLWSLVTGSYVPFSGNVTVTTTSDRGDVTTTVWE